MRAIMGKLLGWLTPIQQIIARVRNSIVVGTRSVLKFLWESLKRSLQAVTILIFSAIVSLLILLIILRPFSLYVDVRETIVEWGKLAHVAIKKRNMLTLRIGHSDSVTGLREEYELQWIDQGYVGTWFAVVNPGEDVYKDVHVFIQFDDRQANKVSIRQEKGWTMFKQGHFNLRLSGEIRAKMLMQTEQIQLQFREKGNYPSRYVIYADGYRPATGALLLRVK